MTETARMYGGSLYDLAAEEGLDERILGELDGVTALLNGDAEYLHLLSIPSSCAKKALCGSCRAAPGLTACATMRLTAFWKRPLFLLCLSRQSRPGACTKSWKKSPAGTSTSKRRSSLLCWAASGWTSKAPSWTAPSAAASPACAAASQQQRCKSYEALRPTQGPAALRAVRR